MAVTPGDWLPDNFSCFSLKSSWENQKQTLMWSNVFWTISSVKSQQNICRISSQKTNWNSVLPEGWQRNSIQLKQILTPIPEPGEDKGLPDKVPPMQYMEAETQNPLEEK